MDVDRKQRRFRLTERLQTLRERTQLLEAELNEYTSQFFRVCIFGSARIKPEDEIYQTTRKIAHLMGMHGIDVLTGGGPGLMEAANQGVLEGKQQSGSRSRSIGISIELNQLEPLNDHIDVKHHHKKFSSRLDDFMRLSNAIIVMPGGIGTMLELVFSWQLLQVGHLPGRPIVLVGRDFWTGLLEWMKDKLAGRALVSPGDFRWLSIVDEPDEVMQIIQVEHQKFLDFLKAKGATPKSFVSPPTNIQTEE